MMHLETFLSMLETFPLGKKFFMKKAENSNWDLANEHSKDIWFGKQKESRSLSIMTFYLILADILTRKREREGGWMGMGLMGHRKKVSEGGKEELGMRREGKEE